MNDGPIDPVLPDSYFVRTPRAATVDPTLPPEIFVHEVPRVRASSSTPGESGTPRRRSRPADAGRLRPGATVDKYRIEELLGVGGFAVVYRATHLLLSMQVALKLLRADVVARRPQLAAHLLQEARFAARIDHPNVVKVLDVTHTSEITYIVMELIRGRNLARLVGDRGALPVAQVLQIGRDVVAGLAAGLAQGLIHRDIKPANILLASANGAARIVDLGLANAAEPGGTDGLLRDAMVVGTRGYMSPEQLRDPRAVDFRSDIYSLGVTLREAATGIPPSTRHAPPRTSSPVLDHILDWMVAPDPAERPESYAALDAELRRVATDRST